MRVQFNFVFDRKKDTKKTSGKGLIELRAYQNAKASYFSTKIRVRSSDWNESKQEIKSSHPDCVDLNIRLRKIKKDIELKNDESHFKNRSFTLEDVKAHFKNKKTSTSSFIEFIRHYLAENRTLKPKTVIQHHNTINKLLDYNSNKDILFSDINYSFVDGFVNYLGRKKFAKNTIHKQHKNLKKYIDLAIKNNLVEIQNPCKDITVKSEEKPRNVLTIDEIKLIEELCYQEKKIEQVKNMFLFACYTGLRISDVCALKTEFVKEKEPGLELNFHTIKVNKHAVLPLYILFPVSNEKSKPEQILLKYFDARNEFVFPKLSEQFINRHLKVIASDTKINFNLTFHIARETFGTYMASKIPLGVLMKLLQHSDIKTTMRYVHYSEQLIKEQLQKVDWNEKN